MIINNNIINTKTNIKMSKLFFLGQWKTGHVRKYLKIDGKQKIFQSWIKCKMDMKEENISHAKPKKKVYFHNFKEIVRMWKMIGKNIHFIVK